MLKDQKKYLLLLYMMFDTGAVFIAYTILFPAITKLICSVYSNNIFKFFISPDEYYLLFSPIIILFIIIIYISRGYNHIFFKEIKEIYYQTIISCVIIGCISYFIASLYSKQSSINLIFVLLFSFLVYLMTTLNRLYFYYFMRYDKANSNLIKYVLIVGTDEFAVNIVKKIDCCPEFGIKIVGFLTNNSNEVGKSILNYPIVSTIKNLSQTINNYVIDLVLYTGGDEHLNNYSFIFDFCFTRGINFGDVMYIPEEYRERMKDFIDYVGDVQIVLHKNINIDPLQLFIKRIFDFVSTMIGIFICLPIYIVVSIAVKMDSKGPVFFRQQRIGKNGRRFIMYKFRSMVAGADKLKTNFMHLNEMDGPAFKIKNDPRQTRIGKLIRKTSLDELPQLLNVFKGDICLVGPRPAILQEIIKYRPWERKRLSVNQGITCLWQVSGRNNIKFDEWMKLDIMYIENWSFGNDLTILFMTIPSVISAKGAS